MNIIITIAIITIVSLFVIYLFCKFLATLVNILLIIPKCIFKLIKWMFGGGKNE